MKKIDKNNLTGNMIRRLRGAKGLTQKDAATRMNISQQSYSDLEKKEKVEWSTMLAVFQAINCNTDDLKAIIKMM